MEERIIDDEYGRGVRLKKTKDGYVDVTDEELEKGEAVEEEGDEITFSFPTMGEEHEDDEDLVDLSPEEAERVRKEKAEALARRQAEYKSACEEGEKLLAEGAYEEAEKVFEKALILDEEATEASVGYWRAKTANFENPDVLIAEYVDASIESLEFDLGYEAAEIVKRDYRAKFEQRVQELTAEEGPLAKKVEEKQERRREILSSRKLRWGVGFIVTLLPLLAAIISTIVIGMKNFGTPDSKYIVPTIVLAGVSVAVFVVFMVVANKFINASRLYRMNENLTSTEDGERLFEIREYKALYEALLYVPTEEDEINYDGE